MGGSRRCVASSWLLTHHAFPVAGVAYWQGDTKVWYNDEGEQVTDDPKVRSG